VLEAAQLPAATVASCSFVGDGVVGGRWQCGREWCLLLVRLLLSVAHICHLPCVIWCSTFSRPSLCRNNIDQMTFWTCSTQVGDAPLILTLARILAGLARTPAAAEAAKKALPKAW
jgi:hypothetical protein